MYAVPMTLDVLAFRSGRTCCYAGREKLRILNPVATAGRSVAVVTGARPLLHRHVAFLHTSIKPQLHSTYRFLSYQTGIASGLCPFTAHGSPVTAYCVPVYGSWCPVWKGRGRFSSFWCEVEVPHLVRLVRVASAWQETSVNQSFLMPCHKID
jgi:hypothetical protein